MQKIVLVTGASTGIGAACAHQLSGRGFRVFAGVRRDVDGAALADHSSGRITPLILDITNPRDIAAAAARIGEDTGGALVGLVNNAGIAVAGPLEFVAIDDFRLQLEVNVVGHLAVTQAMLPMLRERMGRIVNVSSVAGKFAQPFVGPYSASKFALEALSDALRIELAPWKIAVSVIEPGAVTTPIWQKSLTASVARQQRMPEQVQHMYGRALALTTKFALQADRDGVAAATVAAAVEHALTAARPRIRYRVGRQAKAQIALTRILPDRVRDELIFRSAHLPR